MSHSTSARSPPRVHSFYSSRLYHPYKREVCCAGWRTTEAARTRCANIDGSSAIRASAEMARKKTLLHDCAASESRRLGCVCRAAWLGVARHGGCRFRCYRQIRFQPGRLHHTHSLVVALSLRPVTSVTLALPETTSDLTNRAATRFTLSLASVVADIYH